MLEASVTNQVVDAFPRVRGCAQQGGLLFELKSEPATLQCQVEEKEGTDVVMDATDMIE